ncbi:uncharacterized protein LOC143174715 isoform X3 [Nomia melanderi]|uniref:uncharacterized protein LOC143174715 isoform X3 n=1 Tax=Nomia melanderi TaxID=2448451 RepID=UPI003FCC6ADF
MPFEPPCVVVWVHIYQTVSGIPCVLRINGRSSCKGEIEARSLESYHSLGRMERILREMERQEATGTA